MSTTQQAVPPHQGLLAVVARARGRAVHITAHHARVELARKKTERSAARALRQLNDLFLHVAGHKHELTKALHVLRKSAYRPITDTALVCRLLGWLVRQSTSGKPTEGGAAHARLALLVGGPSGGRGARVARFVVGDGHTLAAWKQACKVYACVEGEQWQARPNTKPHLLPPLGVARSAHGAAAVTSSFTVLVAGGGTGNGVCDTVERLAPDHSAWQTVGTIPTARYRCGVCAVGRAVVVVGGFVDNDVISGAVEAVDSASGAHTTLPSLPKPVQGCAVASLGGKVIVTGGFDGSNCVAAAWALDVGNDDDWQQQQQQPQQPQQQPQQPQQQPSLEWTPLALMATGRNLHGAAAGGGCAFVCGGYINGADIRECEMLRLGQGPGVWEALPPLPQCNSELGCCYGGGNLFVAGGDPHGQALLALRVGDTEWAQVGGLQTGRSRCAAVCVGRRVMVLGGFVNARGLTLGGCEVFEF